MIFEESYTLHNGVAIPKLALGTWFIDDDKAAEAVRAAVNIGYRQGRSRRGKGAHRLHGAQRKLKQSCHSRF